MLNNTEIMNSNRCLEVSFGKNVFLALRGKLKRYLSPKTFIWFCLLQSTCWLIMFWNRNLMKCCYKPLKPTFHWNVRTSWYCVSTFAHIWVVTRGGSRGRVQGVRTSPPPPEMTSGFLIQLVFCQKKLNYVVYWCWRRVRDECTPS